MNKTKIEWTNYTWNPVTGCLNDCWYCYVSRLEAKYGYPRIPQFHQARLRAPYGAREGSRIFVCSTADLFGPWVPVDWIEAVLAVARDLPKLTFQFLTKFPEKYLSFRFPENCWLGTTIENTDKMQRGSWLADSFDNVKFISFEPLLGSMPERSNTGDMVSWFSRIDWIIIGAFTGSDHVKFQPKKEWVSDLVALADKHKTPVFLKNSLKDSGRLWEGPLRQEYPAPRSTRRAQEALL